MELKGSRCSKASLLFNDIVYHLGSIFRCINKTLLSFQEMPSGRLLQIDKPFYWRLEVLQLIPMRWVLE